METKPKLENIDLGEVLGVGAALAAFKQIGEMGAPYAALPKDWHVVELSKYLPFPKRPTGSLSLGSADAFVRYVNKHKDKPGQASNALRGIGGNTDGSVVDAEAVDPDDMQTIILADVVNSRFRAVFDHNSSDAAGWKEHAATYDCPLSPQWKLWMAHNGSSKAKDQEDFAFFLEQNILDVVEPVGSTMLEIVTTLKQAKNVAFDSGLRLSDGRVQLKYHEENKTTAGEQGQLQIPERIKLGIPVYVGAPPYAVEALFRYRIQGTKIIFWYDLVTPDRILEDSLNKVITQIETGTGIKTYAVTSIAA